MDFDAKNDLAYSCQKTTLLINSLRMITTMPRLGCCDATVPGVVSSADPLKAGEEEETKMSTASGCIFFILTETHLDLIKLEINS